MFWAPVFIFISDSSALLGRLSCGLIDLIVYNCHNKYTFLSFCHFFWREKTDKTRKYLKFAIFVCPENGRQRLLAAQSINTERASWSLHKNVYVKNHEPRGDKISWKIILSYIPHRERRNTTSPQYSTSSRNNCSIRYFFCFFRRSSLFILSMYKTIHLSVFIYIVIYSIII